MATFTRSHQPPGLVRLLAAHVSGRLPSELPSLVTTSTPSVLRSLARHDRPGHNRHRGTTGAFSSQQDGIAPFLVAFEAGRRYYRTSSSSDTHGRKTTWTGRVDTTAAPAHSMRQCGARAPRAYHRLPGTPRVSILRPRTTCGSARWLVRDISSIIQARGARVSYETF